MYAGFRNPTPDEPVPCGRYELLERIGYGGMAEVFRARLSGPSGFEKSVVIKRILPRLAHDNLVVRMFIEEAKIAAAAAHDNIASVFELGVADDGKFFMVMEYIQGIDLELLLGAATKRTLRLPPWFAMHTVSEVLEALSYVHNLRDEDDAPRNVIHRDATPSNIFISNLGQVKLSDFGVADYEGKSPTTQAGQLKGKLAYMSPEQLNNKPLDHRADIFTIGVVLWEALTHQRLFGAMSDVQAMMAICDGKRQKPSALVPDLPPALDDVVLRSLTVDRDKRYDNAEAFQFELLEVLQSMRGPLRRREIREVVRVLTGRQAPSEETSGSMLVLSPRAQSSFMLRLEDVARGDTSENAGSSDEHDILSAPTGLDEPLGEGELLQTMDEVYNPAHMDEVAALRRMVDAQAAVYDDPMDQTLRDDGMPSIALAATPSVIVAPTRKTPSIPDPADTDAEGDTYDGAHPFFVRQHGRPSSKAMAFSAANQRLATWADQGIRAAISSDDRYWIEAAEFAALTSQDLIVEPEAPPTNITVVGSAAQRNIPAVFAILARDRASGTLSVARTNEPGTDGPEEWYDIAVQEGRPIRLRTNVEAMQLPNVMAERGWVPAAQMPGLIHAVVKERQPIERIARDRGFQTPTPRDIARARSKALFQWGGADYTFNVEVDPPTTPPLAGSVLALLPALVTDALTSARIFERIVPKVDVVHEPSWRFSEGVEELELEPHAATLAAMFNRTTTLRNILDPRLTERDHLFAVALLLLEADLWIAVSGE